MTAPHRLWIETTYHAAFRYGGWGVVREAGGALSGQAGGQRGATAARIDLMALIAAFDGLPPGPVVIHSASAGVVGAARLLLNPPAPGSDEAPADDLDLWAQAIAAVRRRPLTLKAGPNAQAAFLRSWAEVGQDKAKGQPRFSAAIPKPNLAKFPLA